MTTKNLSLARFIALCFATFLFIANVKAFAQDAAAQTKAEIERLQQSLKENPIQSPDLADLVKGIDQRLKNAESARSAGRLYLSLENLSDAQYQAAAGFPALPRTVRTGVTLSIGGDRP